MAIYNNTYAIPYFIVMMILFFACIPITNNHNNIGYKYWQREQNFICALLFLLFFGFRGFIATDSLAYYKYYKELPTFFSDSLGDFFKRSDFARWEKGFIFSSIFLKTLSPNYVFFQFINFFVEFIILWIVFNRYLSKNSVLMGFLFYYLFGVSISINLLRNSKAILLFVLSLDCIYQKNFKRFAFFNILGFLFHASAIFYFPFYFILNRKWNRKFILILFIVGCIIFLFQIKWISLILVQLVNVAIPGRIGTMLIGYVKNDVFSSAYGFSIGYLERILTFILVYHNTSKLIEKSPRNLIFINSLYVYCFIYLYFSEMFILVQRFPQLFIYSYWFIWAQLLELMGKHKLEKSVLLFCLFIYGSMKIFYGYNNFAFKYDSMLLTSHLSAEERSYNIKRYYHKLKRF